MRRRQPYPYCCGGQLWKVTRGFFGCGITEDMVKARWGPGVMQLDRVWEIRVRLPPSLCWTQRRGGGGGAEKQCPHGLSVR